MTHLPHLKTIALLTLITGTIGAQTQKTPPPTDWQIEAQVQQALAKDNAFKGASIISGVNKGSSLSPATCVVKPRKHLPLRTSPTLKV
ncbi:MAG TPA: hypothetical protein VK638_49405 [Edaphobacter sp.]|nr:hypothetical protein [Edaphobacter sp.]